MQIGQIIRQHRKMKDMTQEEMANRLGVTAPAVNKWENGNSLPDITLLAPIARLLGVSLDTLLSFREELTQEEIQEISYTLNSMLREQRFEEAFAWAKEKIEQYPNCESLILEAAVLLNAGLMRQGKRENRKQNIEREKEGNGDNREQKIEQTKPDADDRDNECQNDIEEYENTINQWLTGALKSEHEQIRTMAADVLFSFYLNKGQYDKAEESLKYLSEQNPEKKRRQALIFSRTGRKEEAYKGYEELLLSMYQMTNLLFGSIEMLAAQEQDMDKVRMIAEKLSALAEVFEMGEYHKVSGRLELAVMEKDVEATVTVMQQLLSSVSDINHFAKSPLYEHMKFQEISEEAVAQIREDLLNACRDEETYDFLKGDSRWENLK